MGRKKKNDSAKLCELARKYYETEACGNPAKLKCSNFERYAQAHGCDAKAYDFRRDEAVRAFMEEILNGATGMEEAPLQAAYRTLDIDAMLLASRSMEDFKRNLREMDSYWHSIYDAAVRAEAAARPPVMQEAEDLREQLEERISRLEGELADSGRREKHLEEECRYLKRLLKKYLYPAVAEELLRQEKLPVPENTTVRPEAFDLLIEGKFPVSYEGRQGLRQEKGSRQERLVALMKAQVSDGK